MVLVLRVMQEVGRYSTIDMAVDFLTVEARSRASSFGATRCATPLGHALLNLQRHPAPTIRPSARFVTTGHALTGCDEPVTSSRGKSKGFPTPSSAINRCEVNNALEMAEQTEV
jgi:hypothetical protein